MRLLNCKLQNVRIHGDLPVEFSPRITLIGGSNETGKSTLVEALHRTLFLKASATGAPVQALQSRLHLGHPTVQLAFEAKGDTWTLEKRFSGSTGQVSLHSKESSRKLTGPEAEDKLAELLGVGETLGSRQVSNVLPSRWAHLWVMQGSAGDDLLEAGKAHYDFDALRLQLEQSGGAAVQQSAHDQQVEHLIKAALDENFTSRSTKKHSPLWQGEQKLAAANAALKLANDRLVDYQQASDELSSIIENLDILQYGDLPALQERQRLINQVAVSSSKLEAEIKLASQALDPILLRHDTTQKLLQDLDLLSAEIAVRQQRLGELQRSEAEAQASEQALSAELQAKQEARSSVEAQRISLDQLNQLLQSLVEFARNKEDIARLNAEHQQQQENSQKRSDLEQQLVVLAAIGKPELQNLRLLQQELRDANTNQKAMAAGVKLLRADQPVSINGETLQLGEQRQLTAVFELQVGDGVALEISPGGGQALGDLQQQCLTAKQNFEERLKQLGVVTFEEAEQQSEQRSSLEQQLSALAAAPSQGMETLEGELSSLQERSDQLELQIQSLSAGRTPLEQEQPLPSALAELQLRQQEVAQTLTQTGKALRQAEKDQEKALEDINQFRSKRINEASQFQVLQGELNDRQNRLETLNKSHGSRDALATQLDDHRHQKTKQEEHLQRLKGELVALGLGDQDKELAKLKTELEAIQQKIEQLINNRGAAKQRCDSISADDPYAVLEQAKVQLEEAQLDYRSIKRRTDAHIELRDLFQETQADISSRYSGLLAEAVGTYLRPLVPEGPVAQLSFDQAKGFSGLQLRRGQEFYNFAELSGGMREQLAAALRLSMADVLKDGHDGCLPLIFDDAFTNSDADRVQLVKKMLGTAVDRGLQVILLSCDPGAYGSFADQVVEFG